MHHVLGTTLAGEHRALVRDLEVDQTEEGLPFGAVLPVPVAALSVPDREGSGPGADLAELIVQLVIREGAVALPAKDLRKSLDVRRRNGEIPLVHAAHVLGAESHRVDARNEGGPARRAHTCGCERVRVSYPLRGEAVQGRGDRHGIPKGTHTGTHVFGHQD